MNSLPVLLIIIPCVFVKSFFLFRQRIPFVSLLNNKILNPKGIQEYESVMQDTYFRDFVENKFTERGETRFVVEQFIEQEMKKRSESYNHKLYINYVVAVVYGQLIDLRLKEPK